jgi:hypothetical protein
LALCTFAAHSAGKELPFRSGASNEKSCDVHPNFVRWNPGLGQDFQHISMPKRRNAQKIAQKRAFEAKKVQRTASILYR